jgi:tetratricopeptide (TPR) repeat protein
MNSPAVSRPSIAQLLNGPVGGLVLVTLVVACYAYTLSFGYIWDDDQYVTDNAPIRTFAGLSRIWTDISASPQYYPVTLTSFWLEFQLLRDFNPALSHGINFALHACSALLLFHLLRHLAVPGAWLAAAVFAVHPINVESVAWITERKNTLSLALGLAALFLFLRYRGLITAAEPPPPVDGEDDEPIRLKLPTEPRRLYTLFFVLFVAALLSKTTLAVLPGVILVILWWKRGRLTRDDVLPLVAPFVVGVLAGLLTSYIERSPRHVGATGPEWDFGLGRLALAGQTAWFYIGKLLAPHPFVFDKAAWQADAVGPLIVDAPQWLRSILPWPLMFNYPRWDVNPSDLRQWIGTIAVVAVLVAALVLRKRYGRGPLAGVLLYLGCLLPASGLFNVWPMRFSYVADHFAYVAVIPVIVMIVAGAAIVSRRIWRGELLPAAIAGMVLAALCAVTIVHSAAFRDQQALWKATLVRNDQSWLAAVNFGAFWLDQARGQAARLHAEGEPEKAVERHAKLVSAGEAWFSAALRRNPSSYEAIYQLARVAQERRDDGQALALAQRSLDVAAEMQKASFLQPRVLIAQLLRRRGDTGGAIAQYAALQELEPMFADKRPLFFASARTAYGDLLLSQVSVPLTRTLVQEDRERVNNALEQYAQAIYLAPMSVVPKVNAARVIVDTGGPPEEALRLLQEALAIDKASLEAQYLVARVAMEAKQYAVAATQLRHMVATQPRYLPPYVKLAEIYDIDGHRPEAIAVLQQALVMQPDYKPALEMLQKWGATTQPTTLPATRPQ